MYAYEVGQKIKYQNRMFKVITRFFESPRVPRYELRQVKGVGLTGVIYSVSEKTLQMEN